MLTIECPTCGGKKSKQAEQCMSCKKLKPKKEKELKPCEHCDLLYWPLRKGLCGKHYKKLIAYGSPDAGYENQVAASPIGTIEYLLECSEDSNGPLESFCRVWTKAIDAAGYGRYGTADGKVDYAHRLSYELHHGKIANGKYICHKCDVRSCVNPDHLFDGDPQDNHDDMNAKGRSVHPKAHPNFSGPKLATEQVSEIKELLLEGNISMAKIASMFEVSMSTIHRIKFQKTWKEV